MAVRRRSAKLILAAACAGALTASVPATSGSADPGPSGGTYTNEVTRGYSIDFPDPAVMRGKDGTWYAYSTGGPFDEQGERSSAYKIGSSPDLIHWSDAGSVFDEQHRPSWSAPTTGFWAPDVRYLNGRYLLYFTVPDTTASDQTFDPAIGVATAPTPAGPWTPSDEPIIPAKPVGDGYDTVIDPAMFTDTDGTHYLYYGGFNTGLWVVRLSSDGLRVESEPTHVTSSRYEGPYVVHQDGWYYMFGSSSNCCAGPTTGYTVFAGRSRNPLGPFVDRLGVPLLGSRAGGTPVIAPNGNKWIGTGHHSAVVDASGQPYMAYHAIDRNDPWLDVQPGFTMRPMNLDRLDWIDGWPIVRAGLGASDDPQPAPVTRGEVDDRFEDAAATRSNFTVVQGGLDTAGPDGKSDSGRFGQLSGVTARYDGPGHHPQAVLDADAGVLRLEASAGSDRRVRTSPLPDGFDAEARGRTVTADLTDGRLDDPWAMVSLDLPRELERPGQSGIVGSEGGEVDNFSAARLFEPVRKAVPTPKPGKVDPAYSDEFDGGLGAGWTWLREDPNAQVTDGVLTWPTQTSDIVGDGTPGLLLRDAMPNGDYSVETRLTIDLGEDTVRNFQQGGIIVYVGDDEFLRYDVAAVGPGRITEFGKETVLQGRRSWGSGLAGAPGDTTWLRLVHTRDAKTGEHRFRAASSTDGAQWTWGLTWTLPADTTPRIGLASHGSTPEATAEFGPATSEFDYFRVTRP